MAKQKAPQEQPEIFVADKIEMVAIDKLKHWDRNPRHNDKAVESVANSIRAFGMIVPIVINDEYEVPAGDTRLKACKLLGLKKVPCVNAKHLSKEQQTAFNIADNKLSEIATWDEDMLKDILTGLQAKVSYDFTLLGFEQGEVDLLFNGWNSTAGRIGDITAENAPAPAKIVIRCIAGDETALREILQDAIVKSGIQGVTIQ